MAQPTYEQLVEQNRQLRREAGEKDRRIAELQGQVAHLESRLAAQDRRIAELEKLLEQRTRGGKRQAAPFSKGEPKSDPKPPGRKPGPDYGQHAFRSAPPPRKIDEVHEAAVPAQCPACGGRVRETHVATQYQTEIPRRPIHRQFNVHVGECTCCGQRVQGRHPLQTSDALGAAASQLGPDLQATIVQLNKDAGLSHGKIQRLMKTLFGIELSRGGSVQVMLRAARRCEPIYQAMVRAMPGQQAVTPDETGWRIGGAGAWLHAFAAERITAYVIDWKRGGALAEGVLGSDYAGALIHDGWAPYDRFWNALHQQCLAHLLRRCVEMIEAATTRAVQFPRQVKTLLQDALALRDRHAAGQVSNHGLAVARGRLETRLHRLLAWPRANAANERFARHLVKHRDQLFTFLYCPGLDATNYRAEQAIRPAVVNRKVWGGSRTEVGAGAQSILMSVLRTCAQQHRDALAFVSRTLCGQRPRLLLAPT
jgi:transposase